MVASGGFAPRPRAGQRPVVWTGAALASAILLASGSALPAPAALPHVARLEYLLAPGAKGCSPEAVFRSAVGSQVGHAVLAAGAPALLRVTLSRRAKDGHYEAALDLFDTSSALLLHQVTPPSDRCSDAVQAAAVIAAETLDPVHVERPSPPPPPPPVTIAVPAPPPVIAAEPSPWEGHAGLGSWLGLGVAPRPAAGLSGEVGIRWRMVSLSGELRWDPPAGVEAGDGARLSTWRLIGAALPCGHLSWESWGLFGCGVVQAGKIWGRSEGVPAPATIGEPYLGMGARFGAELRLMPITPHLGLRLSADVLGNVTRSTFLIDDRAVWTTPRLAGGVGLGVFAFW